MPRRCRGDALESAGGGRARGRYGNRDAGRSQADRPAGRRPRLRSGPRGMRRAEAAVVPAGAAREAGREGEQPGQRGGGPQQSCGQGKKFLYSEPHKRIKEVLEEELYIKRDECHIKNPPAVALERIWSIKRNLPVGNLKPELPSRNSLLPQTTYYSRHGGLRR
ncbi:uncharacterized protein C11orf97 homolog [Canis lupus baileyi]|uniref:uncharacterized protein C11orf97 homolog n=1 Tax=Canis lupus baileyi TaxID=143281 RepID=UPI003B97BF8E